MTNQIDMTFTVQELVEFAKKFESSMFYIDMSPIVEKWSPDDEMLGMVADAEYGELESVSILKAHEHGELVQIALLEVSGYPAYALPLDELITVDRIESDEMSTETLETLTHMAGM